MPASKSRKGKRWQVCPVCRQIKGRDGYHEDHKKPNGMASWCIACTRARQYEEWRRRRRGKNRAREDQLRERGKKRLLARRLFREGAWQEEIVRRTGLPRIAVSRFIADLKPDRDKEIARLYVDEEVSTLWLGEHFGLSRQGISHILNKQGVQLRPPGGWHQTKEDAGPPTVGRVIRAARHRPLTPPTRLPKGGNIGDSLTQKGHLLVEILKAAPAPLSVKQIIYVGQGLPLRPRFSIHGAATRDALKRLEKHGFVRSGRGLLLGARGRPVVGWFVPADQKESPEDLTPEEIQRQIEIRKLIEQQQAEENDRIGRGRAVSLDAPLTDSGSFTILDTLHDEADVLTEMAAA